MPKQINLQAVHAELVALDLKTREARDLHNAFLEEVNLPLLPWVHDQPSAAAQPSHLISLTPPVLDDRASR